MTNNLLKLWILFSSKKKRNLFFLILYIVIGSVLEFSSLGLVIPLVSIVADPEVIFSYLKNFSFINIYDENTLTIIFIFLFIGLSIMSGIFRTILISKIASISYLFGADLNKTIYSQLIYQDYIKHIGLDRNKIINILTTRTKLIVTNVVYPIFSLFSSITLSLVIIVLLLIVDYKLTFFVAMFIIIFYLIIFKLSRKNLGKYGEKVSRNSSLNVQYIRDSLSNIKDIKLDNEEDFYINNFTQLDKELHLAESKILIIGLTPKYIIECLMMILFGLAILYFHNTSYNFNQMVPFFALLALSAQRLLPQFQQIFYCFASLKGANSSLQKILETLDSFKKVNIVREGKVNLAFNRTIVLKNIFFKYPGQSEYTLKNINLIINKEDSIGLIGRSGSGKSTLLDIIMGLLEPSSGEIFIDNKKITSRNRYLWQRNISYVPQSIFLFNKSVKDNIVSSTKNYDSVLLNKILEIVNLKNDKSNSSIIKKINSHNIGEFGEKISGGQRQKIAIARALYKNSNIIVFDEATSALDSISEKIIMNNISVNYSSKTLIMVTHRKSTLAKCNKIFEIINGKLIKK